MKRKFQTPLLGGGGGSGATPGPPKVFKVPVLPHLKKAAEPAPPRAKEDASGDHPLPAGADGAREPLPHTKSDAQANAAAVAAAQPRLADSGAAGSAPEPSSTPAKKLLPGLPRVVGGLRRPGLQKPGGMPAVTKPHGAVGQTTTETRIAGSLEAESHALPLRPSSDTLSVETTERQAVSPPPAPQAAAAAQLSLTDLASSGPQQPPQQPQPQQQRPRYVHRLPAVLTATLPAVADLGVTTSMPSSRHMLSSLPVPSVDVHAVRELDNPVYGDLCHVVLQLEEGLLPEPISTAITTAPKPCFQMLLAALEFDSRKVEGHRLATSLVPGLAGHAVKVQFGNSAADASRPAMHPAKPQAGNMPAESAISSAGKAPSADLAQGARAACYPPDNGVSSHDESLSSAPGLPASLAAGNCQPAVGSRHNDSRHVTAGSSQGCLAQGRVGVGSGAGVSCRRAGAADMPHHVPAPQAWEEKHIQQLIGEQHRIPLSFLKGLFS